MLKKSLVSISFASGQKLQIAQLNSAKKKIINHATLTLPDGLIVNSRVQDTEKLSRVLQEVWKKVGIREKSVGIVVPESSTFTKILELPKIGINDLDEAVRWQANDFLPVGATEFVLDWKVIKEDKGIYHILVVAMDKSVLKGYVQSAGLAGLYPLVVETPSLSLVRLSNSKINGKLIIYESFGEAIILLSSGQKIVSSSVVKGQDQEQVVNTASRMRNHYSGIKVEKILFGGGGITNELVAAVKKTLGSEVGKLSIKIEGISDDKIQEYLIPLSLQLKDPSEPADESTINLLPPELVKKYTGEKLKGQIWSLTLSVTLVVWVAFFAILGSYMYLSQQINSLRSSSVVLNLPPDKANALDLINKINSAAEKVITIDKFSFSPNVVINMINKVKFEGVSVQRYRIDLEAGKIEIIGIASTRKDLIDFKDALEEYEDFSLVQIPISSLEAESNLEYDMKFIYLPAAPKKKK